MARPDAAMDDLRSKARVRLLGPRPNGDGAPLRVLVVGPVSESGGLARVARMTTEGLDPQQFDIAVCDTARDTPADRSFWAACLSHLGRWMRLIRLLSRHWPDVVHVHTCSYATFYRTVLDVLTCITTVHGGCGDPLPNLPGARHKAETLEATCRGTTIAQLAQEEPHDSHPEHT